MAANIQQRDVQVGIEQAWHNQTVVEETINKDNCRILYPMEIHDTYFYNKEGDRVKANGRQIVSMDDELPVGKPVGPQYQLFSNSKIWDAVETSLGGTKHKIVSCGTVDNRALGFVSIKVSDDFIAANRETQSVLNILWGHGGNRAVVARTGMTVVVCQNTYNVAMQQGDMKISVRHTSNANIMDLSEAIDTHIGVAAEFKKAMNEFHNTKVSVDDARKIYAGFITKPNNKYDTGHAETTFTNRLNQLVGLFQTGAGNQGKTMADVFNGATDFYTHHSARSNNPWNQFVTSEFGMARNKKIAFFDILSDKKELNEVKKRGEKTLMELSM